MFPHSIDLKLMADDVRRAYEARGFRSRTLTFTYTTPPITVAGAGGSGVATLETDRDSLFVWLGASLWLRDTEHGVDGSSTAAVFAQVEILSLGYQLTGRGAIPCQMFTGAGLMPHVFGYPLILVPGERVRVTWINVEEAFQAAQLSLLGVKLFTTPYTREILFPEHDETLVMPEKVGA